MENEEIQKAALKAISNLWQISWPKVLDEKSMQKSTMDAMFALIGSKDWPEKEQTANQIIRIVQSSQSEEEILQNLNDLQEFQPLVE